MRSNSSTTRGSGGRSRRATPKSDAPRRGKADANALATVRGQAAETVASATRQLRDKGGEFLDRQKERAATGLDGMVTSIRQAADDLRHGPLGAAGAYVEAAADAVAGASSYLTSQNLTAMRRDVEQVVRGRPQLFLGGMFVIGLALARFVKAGVAAVDDDSGDRGRGRDQKSSRRRPASAARGTSGGRKRAAAPAR